MSSKKMFLVPPDVMDGLRRKQRLEEIDQPERKVQGDLDAQMNTLLQRNDIPDREKLVLYNQLLQQLLQQKTSTSLKSGSPLVTGPPLPPPPADGLPSRADEDRRQTRISEEQTVESVPSNYRTKATSFLRYLKNNQVHWTDDGSVVIRDQVIPGSNIIDIVNSAVRDRRKVDLPTGSVPLIQYLKGTNVPREIIGSKKLWHAASRETSSQATATPSIRPLTPPTTPLKPAKKKKKTTRAQTKKIKAWSQY